MEIESCITCISDSDTACLVTSPTEPSCATKYQDSTELILFPSVSWDKLYEYEC